MATKYSSEMKMKRFRCLKDHSVSKFDIGKSGPQSRREIRPKMMQYIDQTLVMIVT